MQIISCKACVRAGSDIACIDETGDDDLERYRGHRASFETSWRVLLGIAARMTSAPGDLDTDSADIAALHAVGRIEEIRSYCLTDTLWTSLVGLAWRRRVSDLSAEQMVATQEAVLAPLQATERVDPQSALFAGRWRKTRRDA
ncbi:MAG: hypothetical protein ACFCUS_08895 [Rubrimonas sp.]